MQQSQINQKTIQRLSLYRRLLYKHKEQNQDYIYSYKLASLANTTPAQVRRDFMSLNQTGNNRKGYNVHELINEISHLLDAPQIEKIGLVGVGNLGRAIIDFFIDRRPNLRIVAAFDKDKSKIGPLNSLCYCYHSDEIAAVVQEKGISIGVITVPESSAQSVADILVLSGIKGIINFAPLSLKVPRNVFLEEVDLTMVIEKTAFFVRQRSCYEITTPK